MMEYNQIKEQDLMEITTFIDRERLLFGAEINEEYSHDELASMRSYPTLVARVTSTEEVSKLMAYANAHHIAVTPRGAGT